MEIIYRALDLSIIFAIWLVSGCIAVAIFDKIGKKLAERRHRKELVRRAVWMTCRNKGRI